ncbi:Co-chaperone Hsc20 [Polychaeton citri CBS 116435]|uniref:Co-chaperone Hsc20 n=1 Tax=Polychaeton citri CBS 116435 TaxID=1314669 RepID=A0A9P4Q4Y7_9PEZI|nr:Co-chaperone Hsc20 [Polychaeton citri CBS 116435]
MRSTFLQHTRHALNSPRHGTPLAQRGYVCASCLRASNRHTPISPSFSVAPRTFTTSTPRHQETQTGPASSFQRESIVPQTHYEFFPATFPSGPPPSSTFSPDLKQLRKEFLHLQAKNHPDLAPSDRKRQAEAASSRINEAYKTLQDPLRRAQYLLSLKGIDVEDESAKLEDNALLMEVMEAREAVEEVEDEDGLIGIREENNGRIAKSIAILEDCFAKGEDERAAQEAIRLRYWANIEESIHGWEKGKGGGIIHH